MAKYDATERQISFIVSMAVERGFTYNDVAKTLVKDPTVVELTKLTKRGASNLITWLRDQRKAPAATPPKRLATENQVGYLVKLADRAGWEVEDTQVTNPEGKAIELTELPVKVASELIGELRDAPRAHRRPKPDPSVKITEDGMYRIGEQIYKVQVAVHGSGFLYAKRLVIDSPAVRDANGNISQPGQAHYERDASAMAKLLPEHRLTLADAKGFGDLYGVCMRCAATLTDEDSIAAGAGPVCRGKI
jgi:hypothetical protein